MRRTIRIAALSLVAAAAHAAAPLAASAQLLDASALLARHDWRDDRDDAWYAARIPFLETPDAEIDATYYYRWEVVAKHLTYGSPEHGWTFTEFLDRPFWSGRYGGISCPLGHQMYEVRWLKDDDVVHDFARYWLEVPGAEPRSYANWYGDAVWATYLVNGDTAFLRRMLPNMKRQYAGWVAERYDSAHGMFRWDGLHDGMERNINSRQTTDIDEGAVGYRPTLNAYMFADARAIARASALFGDTAEARVWMERAERIRRRVHEELWDERREFFLHQSANDEPSGVRAKTRTYDSGRFAGNRHGRELIGYVPWQFSLPERGRGYERAWRFLTDTSYFAAPFGPTTAERGDPQFLVSDVCCWWSGNSWPFATTQTLAAMANLLNEYEQPHVTSDDWFALLKTYSRTQRKNGRPYIAEAANPFTGSWEGHDTFYHSEHYFHSAYVDQVVTGLVGLRPRADDTLEVRPLAPTSWAYFALDDVAYRGRRVSIVWDRDGTRYGRGRGLTLIADGRPIASSPTIGRLTAALPPPSTAVTSAARTDSPRFVNLAVNIDRGAFPSLRASFSAPRAPTFYAIDGSRWYHASPGNRWSAEGSPNARDTLVLDFGLPRPIEELRLYWLDDGPGAPVRPPESFTVERWTGDRWAAITGERRSPERPEGRRANVVAFARVETPRLRVVVAHRGTSRAGLTEIEAWGRAALPLAEPTAVPTNLATTAGGGPFPTATASFTAEGARAELVNDARIELNRYSRNRWTAARSPNERDWVEIDFGAARTVRLVELYLATNDRDLKAPRDYTVQWWDGSAWRDATVLARAPERPAAWAVNRVRIAPATTTKLRVTFTHDRPAFTAVTEIAAYEWESPR